MLGDTLLLKNDGLNQVIKRAVTIGKKATLLEARSVLLRYKISRLVVIEGKAPIGILTEKDLVRSIYEPSGKPIEDVKVSEIMTRHLITSREGDTVYDCAKLMLGNRISSIIILDKEDNLAGVVTKTDLVSVFLTQCAVPLNVSSIMTKGVITVKPADSLLYVENILVKNKVSRVVVERNRKPVGIITHRDFIPAKIPLWLRRSGDSKEVERYRMAERPSEFDFNQLSFLSTFIAADIMTPNPVTIQTTEDLSEASLLMVRHGISGLPVVKNSLLVGIVTKTDIVRPIA